MFSKTKPSSISLYVSLQMEFLDYIQLLSRRISMYFLSIRPYRVWETPLFSLNFGVMFENIAIKNYQPRNSIIRFFSSFYQKISPRWNLLYASSAKCQSCFSPRAHQGTDEKRHYFNISGITRGSDINEHRSGADAGAVLPSLLRCWSAAAPRAFGKCL